MAMDLRLAFTDSPPYGDAPVKVNCFRPNHHDDTASLAIYPDHLHCYGCGWHLGPRQAAAAIAAERHVDVSAFADVDYHPRPRTAVKDLRAEPLDSMECVRQEQRLQGEPFESARLPWAGERFEALNWLGERGLSSEAIRRARLGHDGWRFVIPLQSRNYDLLTLRYRVDPFWDDISYAGPKYMGYKGRNGLLLYGENWVNPDTDWLVLCEGELDALRLWQEALPGIEAESPMTASHPSNPVRFPAGHFPAVSATNGARQMEKLVGLIRELFPKVRHVVIASDQDRAGHEAARDTALALQRAGYTWERAFWDTGKDVTEYLQSGGSPALFLPSADRKGNMADIIVRLAHCLAS